MTDPPADDAPPWVLHVDPPTPPDPFWPRPALAWARWPGAPWTRILRAEVTATTAVLKFPDGANDLVLIPPPRPLLLTLHPDQPADDYHAPAEPTGTIPGSNMRLGLAFAGDVDAEQEHREALREACELAGKRERNYDQPWWAANVKALLNYAEACEAALNPPRPTWYTLARLAHGLLAIARQAMPDTFYATDSRCELARAVLAASDPCSPDPAAGPAAGGEDLPVWVRELVDEAPDTTEAARFAMLGYMAGLVRAANEAGVV